MAGEPFRKGPAGEGGERSFPADAERFFHQPARRVEARYEIDERRKETAVHPAHGRDMAEETGPQRRAVRIVVLREEFELDLRHVDRRRALGLARLALDAQVHDLVHAPAGQLFVRKLAR